MKLAKPILLLALATPFATVAQAPAPAYLQVRPAIPHGTVQSVAYKSKALGTGGAHAYPVWQRNLNEVAPLLFPD